MVSNAANRESKLEEYISSGRVMQLATAASNQPWVCSVYYVADSELNLYWLSWPTRRHSREIEANNKVAITIPVKTDLPVIGIQAEGIASIVEDVKLAERIMQKYIEKYDAGHKFTENLLAGVNHHVMYKFTPKNYVLFDDTDL